MEVRLATPQDAEELLEIYRYYVEHTAITFEYETPSITEFRQRIKQTLGICGDFPPTCSLCTTHKVTFF